MSVGWFLTKYPVINLIINNLQLIIDFFDDLLIW